MKKNTGADECDAAFSLTIFLTGLVNISLPVLVCFIQIVLFSELC